MTIADRTRCLAALALLLLAASSSGCSTLNVAGAGWPFPPRSGGPPAPVDPNAPHVLMEIHPAKGQPQKLQAPLTEPISVQQAIEETGVARRFRRVNVTIYRLMPDGSYARMGVRYDKRKSRIESASDYLLHPGDRIVVEQDTTTVLDDMMVPLLGPLSSYVGT